MTVQTQTYPGGYILVARADGVGSGRLLAASLRDALDNRAQLLSVCEATDVPTNAYRAVDFVFAGDGDTDEVIRAGVDEYSHVVCAQLLRCPKGHHLSLRRDTSALEHALRDGQSVAELRWEPPRGARRTLQVVVRTDNQISVAVPGT